ncbi:hypothetical protein ACFVMC_14965 [Nocardia sp. NPDC127579]|uniref:hypothetical protein n=1 Tax=Nocardia sp. NPDC127579 TaxID=3345402 RepID=UPI003645DB10
MCVSEWLLRWHQANALTAAGAHAQAGPIRDRYLELPFTRYDQLGNSLQLMDQAAAQIEASDLEQGCHTITSAWSLLPDELRIGQAPRRVFEIIDNLRPIHAAAKPTAEVREILRASMVDSGR